MIMQVVASYACNSVTVAMMASANRACAQDSNLSVPNVTVTAPAALVDPPYMRDPWEGKWEKSLFPADIASRRINFGKYHALIPASRSAKAAKPTGKADGEKEGKGVRHRALWHCAWPGSGADGVQRRLAGSRVEGGSEFAFALPSSWGAPRRRMIAATEHPSSCSAVEGN
jgi:hypothetical protein